MQVIKNHLNSDIDEASAHPMCFSLVVSGDFNNLVPEDNRKSIRNPNDTMINSKNDTYAGQHTKSFNNILERLVDIHGSFEL